MAKSNLVSWMGTGCEFICLLVKEFLVRGKDAGEADERIREAIKDLTCSKIKKIVDILLGVGEVIFRLTAKIDRDMTGWECVEPVEFTEGEFEPVLHEFVRFGDKGKVNGCLMVNRAKEMGAMTGLRHVEAMLREQEKIPVEWRKHVLVFAEVWWGPSGNWSVWCLYWDGGRWCPHCIWPDNDPFGSHCRLVSARKYKG